MNNKLAILFLFLAFIFTQNVKAQWQHRYINYHRDISHFRTAGIDSTQLELPFWDDFSQSTLIPDTSLWFNTFNVAIQSGVGINPPSWNVAVFDGADQFGNPYSDLSTEEGIGDSLVSKFIDLSGANQNNTFLSFYFQKEGRGELPDETDFLRLLFKRNDNTWDEIWRISGADLEENEQFSFEVFRLDSIEYFHEYFQFKFESFGRLSGPFDTWNVDYVYFDDNRNGNKLDLSDHTIMTVPTSILGKYTHVPYDQFMADPSLYLGNASFDMTSMEGLPTNIETTVLIQNMADSSVIDTVNFERELESNIDPFEIVTFTSDAADPDAFTALEDSLFFSTFIYILTLDTIDVVNLRLNDTIKTHHSIYQELAYDDGTAEFSTGLNSFGGEIAYRFFTPVEDQITGLKIHFPKFNTGGTGNSFIIKVWSDLNNEESSVLYSQSAVKREATGINEFAIYEFNKPVTVSDTFYIGYEQRAEGLFVVGYDKNNNTGDQIFFNTGLAWEPNTDLTGSLMMRPIFGDAEEVITGVDPEVKDFTVYPNPSDGLFHFRGSFKYLEVYDSFGRKINVVSPNANEFLNLRGFQKGIYLLKVFDGNDEWIEKIIIR